MELFAIHCTTCKAKLIVKDEAVIGDILACPKCSSMVHIVPPIGWKRPGGEGSSLSSLSGSAEIVAPASKPAPVSKNPAPISKPAATPASAKSVPAKSATPLPRAATQNPKAPQAASPQPKAAPLPKRAAAAAAVIPPALPARAARPAAATTESAAVAQSSNVTTTTAAASTATTPIGEALPETIAATPTFFGSIVATARQHWILLSSGLAGGVTLGGLVWVLVASQASPVATPPAAPTERLVAKVLAEEPKIQLEPTKPDPAKPDPTAVVDGDPVASPTSTEPTTSPPTNPEGNAQPAANVSENSAPAETAPTTATPNMPTAEAPPAGTPPAKVADATPPALTTTEVVKPTPSLKLEPVVPVEPTAVDPAAAATAPDPALTPPQTKDPKTGEPAAGPERDESANPAPDDDDAETANSKRPASLGAEEIEIRLSVELGKIEFTKVPLAHFAEFIADVSGVPVSIDEAALKQAGRKRQSPVTVKLSGSTAGDALRAAVEPLGLSCVIEADRIRITKADSAAPGKPR